MYKRARVPNSEGLGDCETQTVENGKPSGAPNFVNPPEPPRSSSRSRGRRLKIQFSLRVRRKPRELSANLYVYTHAFIHTYIIDIYIHSEQTTITLPPAGLIMRALIASPSHRIRRRRRRRVSNDAKSFCVFAPGRRSKATKLIYADLGFARHHGVDAPP